jgi:hypothetical protein
MPRRSFPNLRRTHHTCYIRHSTRLHWYRELLQADMTSLHKSTAHLGATVPPSPQLALMPRSRVCCLLSRTSSAVNKNTSAYRDKTDIELLIRRICHASRPVYRLQQPVRAWPLGLFWAKNISTTLSPLATYTTSYQCTPQGLRLQTSTAIKVARRGVGHLPQGEIAISTVCNLRGSCSIEAGLVFGFLDSRLRMSAVTSWESDVASSMQLNCGWLTDNLGDSKCEGKCIWR